MSRDEKQTLLSKERYATQSRHVLVIHGGAGTILRKKSSPEQQALYHSGLRAALQSGNAILNTGGEAMDAVVAAVSVMEGEWKSAEGKGEAILTSERLSDNPLFNSGKGAVFNSAGFVRALLTSLRMMTYEHAE